ncbi:MAG: SDR family NAD(P)-dependent oxidoreductase [Verrucomicrobiota bacterium]|jgi:3-oxoacyl-[acyl-carrier protein] reductase
MESLLTLRGKIALVTGSTRGIGWASARLLAQHGATVLVNGGSESDLLKQRVDELKSTYGVEAEGFAFDVGSADAVKECYGAIFKKHKRLDILVNNAGILQDSLLGMVTSESLARVFHVNVNGVVLNMQYAARLMARNQSGSIINISSIVGRVGNSGQVVYGGSKAAVIGLTLSAAKELAPANIRVNAVAPGFIDTDMVRQLPREKFEERVRSIKMGRIGKAEDVARAILFFASDLSAYVTGQVLGVDGGMLI